MPVLLLLLACATDPPPQDSPQPVEPPVDSEPPELPASARVSVRVTLDGAPVEGARVMQGGLAARTLTDAEGLATLTLDLTAPGDLAVLASHPEARIGGELLYDPPEDGALVEIALTRFSTRDNLLYTFQDPGEPDIEDSTQQCSHCHVSIVEDWWGSPHRTSASNPHVQDLYAGVAAAFADEAACVGAGGVWREGVEPGSGQAVGRCAVGAGVLPDLNPGCASCEVEATAFGGCADCHAPGIDGALGGRDLLEAEGIAYRAGVHCDVCHKVESVDLDAEAGVAGRLRVLRPDEALTGPLGPYQPLMFGPYDDVLNPRMGSVAREHFHQATICAGCHELDQEALVPGQALDPARWPDGRLPIHSTYSEWLAGPMAEGVVCQSCHMPVHGEAGNAADLGNLFDVEPGLAAGWPRTPGAVRRHAWVGPRQPESRMLALAAALELEVTREGDRLTAQVTTRNVGPGHAIPTGEPSRALLLAVRARCGDEALEAVGGDVVPDFGGALEQRDAGEEWSSWPEARPGQRLRVVQRSGAWRDYTGHGPFGDGTFTPEQKGMPVEVLAGEVEILAVGEGGALSLSAPLPAGDRVYRVEGGWPEPDAPALALAGAPGYGFARVLVDAEGQRMTPHHRAVDLASDNRLLPGGAWTSEHHFDAAGCEAPVVEARLLHRAFPLALADERGWELQDSLMVEVRR